MSRASRDISRILCNPKVHYSIYTRRQLSISSARSIQSMPPPLPTSCRSILILFSHLMPDQKHLESFEMWCWRRMEKISWTDHVRNEEVLLRVNEQRNILHEIRERKANWIGHILRRNCLLKHVIEGKIKRQEDEEEGVRSY